MKVDEIFCKVLGTGMEKVDLGDKIFLVFGSGREKMFLSQGTWR